MLSAVLIALLGAGATPSDAEAFKALFTQGEQLFEQGEYGLAIWSFRQADRIRPTAEVAFDLAKCHEKLDDLPYATYYYRLYLRRAPDAADSMDVAGKVGAALGEAEGLGKGYVELDGSGSDPTVDGRAHVEFPLALFLSPGDHELSARYPGGVRKHRFTVKTGKVTTVSFEPLPPALVDAVEGSPLFATLPADGSSPTLSRGQRLETGLRYGSLALLGASALALVTGTVYGAMAADDASRLSSVDRSSLTVTQARQLAQQANGKGATANLLWAVGGAGAAVGGAALSVSFVLPEPGQKKASARP